MRRILIRILVLVAIFVVSYALTVSFGTSSVRDKETPKGEAAVTAEGYFHHKGNWPAIYRGDGSAPLTPMLTAHESFEVGIQLSWNKSPCDAFDAVPCSLVPMFNMGEMHAPLDQPIRVQSMQSAEQTISVYDVTIPPHAPKGLGDITWTLTKGQEVLLQFEMPVIVK